MTTSFPLTDQESRGPTWAKVEEHLETRLASLRSELEKPGLGPTETESLRGAIRELKNLRKRAGAQPLIPPKLRSGAGSDY